MCEFLIRVKEKPDVDPDFASPVAVAMNAVHRSVKLLHAGDVVVVCPDGWGWSHAERNNPEWRIVKVPGMSVEQGNAFMSREMGSGVPGEVLRRRHFSVDVKKIKSEMTENEFRAAAGAKPKLVDKATL
jgi:hypothetical protein